MVSQHEEVWTVWTEYSWGFVVPKGVSERSLVSTFHVSVFLEKEGEKKKKNPHPKNKKTDNIHPSSAVRMYRTVRRGAEAGPAVLPGPSAYTAEKHVTIGLGAVRKSIVVSAPGSFPSSYLFFSPPMREVPHKFNFFAPWKFQGEEHATSLDSALSANRDSDARSTIAPSLTLFWHMSDSRPSPLCLACLSAHYISPTTTEIRDRRP